MQVGSILEISITKDQDFLGIWKVGKVVHICEDNGFMRERYELSRNSKKIFVEVVPGETSIAVFKLLETSNTTERSMPPDATITIGDTVYGTCDPSAENNGFTANFDGVQLKHWEYITQDQSQYFQVILYPEQGVLDVFVGEAVTSYKTY